MKDMTNCEPLGFTIEPSIRDAHIGRAIDYFWNAFGAKLDLALRPAHKARAFLRRVIDPSHSISAVGTDGELLGVAGFKTASGAFVGGGLKDLSSVYGVLGGTWRGLLLHALERDCEGGVLLMDGIFVGENARGKGVGSALLKAIVEEARRRGLGAVRLDVIDTNPRARTLYERHGFKPVDEMRLGLLSPLFGFSAATQMRLDLA